ncbi:MAG TPA: lysylphosphatidylglycerol synthase transmembrane domain-containing protein [Phycisphaerae bacterium]|nr:lysylphosphatidylglycerol synthase transmembrane domain-containing protein [Phycisphaerae bacterium]
MSERIRKTLWHVARLLVMAALVAYVVGQAQWDDEVGPDGARVEGIKSIARRLADHWGWAAAALAVMMLQSPVGAVRWRLLLGVQGIHITFLESLRLTYIGWFFNNWLPGGAGGDFVKAYYLARQTHHKTEAVTVVFLDRLIGLVAVCVLGAAAVVYSLNDERVRVAQIIIGVFLAGLVGGGVAFFSRRLRRLLRLDRLLARLPFAGIVARVDRAVLVYRHHKVKVALALVLSWSMQAVALCAMWWLATGLGSRASWNHYVVNMPVVWIGWSMIPVPGGFGVAETLVQRLFTPSVLGGTTPLPAAEAATLALAMILAYRLVQMLVTVPGGVFYLARRTDVSPTHMREALETEPEPDA